MWCCVAVCVVYTTSSVSGKLKALEPRVEATKFTEAVLSKAVVIS